MTRGRRDKDQADFYLAPAPGADSRSPPPPATGRKGMKAENVAALIDFRHNPSLSARAQRIVFALTETACLLFMPLLGATAYSQPRRLIISKSITVEPETWPCSSAPGQTGSITWGWFTNWHQLHITIRQTHTTTVPAFWIWVWAAHHVWNRLHLLTDGSPPTRTNLQPLAHAPSRGTCRNWEWNGNK